MGIFDVNELKAKDHALEQQAQETHAFIVAALREFPAAACQMSTPLHVIKFNLLRKKDCSFLALDYDRNEYGELDQIKYFSGRIAICTDGTYCFARSGLAGPTPWDQVITSAEDFAERLMIRFAEFNDIAFVKRAFESALRGVPVKLCSGRNYF